jgi:hypothetical protein
MSGEHANFGGLDNPASLFWARRIKVSACEYVVETLSSDIYPISGYFDDGFMQTHKLLLTFIPSPSVEDAVASGAILEEVDISSRDGSTAGFFHRIFCSTK